MKYDFAAIESKWQHFWQANGTFAAANPGQCGFEADRPKFYVLDMFPYPSGVGLHVGHPLGYIATDIVARYKRMCGAAVLHPMGYDAFGLPAEQFAVEHGVHPRITTEQNITNMTRQLKRLGLSYDWDRCLTTTDPDYHRWTQWIFLQLYNSWFDPTAGAARPIEQLRQKLEAEVLYVGPEDELIDSPAEGLGAVTGMPIGARKWHELSANQRTAVIANHRLAYMDEIDVNWCPALGTVLANEEVTNEGRSERGNHPVFKRPLRQWMLRITVYAHRLLEDLELVKWPDPIKTMQRNWIGRSEGALVDFAVVDRDDLIRVFTTRPDTLFGATYMVLAPEHPLVEDVTSNSQHQKVDQYCRQAVQRSEIDRAAETKSKTGVFTGACAINPVSGQRLPIWIADYVMMGYGTGAIMAVPAHDQRDHDFARTFGLPIIQVVAEDSVDVQVEAFEGEGTCVNSANDEVSLNSLTTAEAKHAITQWLDMKGLGKTQVQYKLRDWLFSRQRYWGEPFPILHGPDGEIVALDEAELPVELPEMEDFAPCASEDPNEPVQTPLSRAPDSWKAVDRDGKRYTRELNTMPQWAGSCWYYLRFIDPANSERFVGREAEQYWMVSDKKDGHPHAGGVDLYVGGAEHAVLHLLYARFWHKVLHDLGHVSTPEPFGRLFNQGYIQAYAYTDERGVYVPAEEVKEDGQRFVCNGQQVRQEKLGKMGKSLKNAVAPDEICERFGCDSLRLYEMYLGPLDQDKAWSTKDIVGQSRFLHRLWRNFVNEETNELLVSDKPAGEDLRRMLHSTIKRVTDDMETMSYNTAIAALIELNNELISAKTTPRDVAETMVLLLSPIAPHISEELWQRLGHDQSLAYETWPIYDKALLVQQQVQYPVQVNGRLRGRITIATDADDKAIESSALAEQAVKDAIGDNPVRKVIIVRNKMVNIVAK